MAGQPRQSSRLLGASAAAGVFHTLLLLSSDERRVWKLRTQHSNLCRMLLLYFLATTAARSSFRHHKIAIDNRSDAHAQDSSTRFFCKLGSRTKA